MLPVKLKVTNLGKIGKEYREIVKFYENRISKLSRFSAEHSKKFAEDAILLDPAGERITTDDFYELLMKSSADGQVLHFVVGPPEGFGDEKMRYMRLSLSPLTMRHELAYVVLLEQIYRALLRMKGTDYSK